MYNVDYLIFEVYVDDIGRIKNRKLLFWFLKRRGSKFKDFE